jgi:hypothetical protein
MEIFWQNDIFGNGQCPSREVWFKQIKTNI